MTRTTADGRKAAPAFLALAAVGFIATAPAHAADPVAKPDDQDRRDEVVVTGELYETQQESPKTTRPVRDTPQTVTILTAETVQQQNLLTLRDMLSTVPGITFGAAEGGTPPSDQINLRGYSAGSDITQDGVRDSGAYSRSDNFNLEQLEIVNGANSVYGGSGSVGGSINIVTKRPKADTSIVATGGIGTDNYYRGTVDANVRANDLIAVRLNAMVHQNDVPGRDVENYERWGFAPAVTIGIDSPTRLTLQYFHQEDTNIPQYGVPYYKNAVNDGAVPGIDRSDYFGYRNVDTQEINVDQATAIFEHEFSENVSIRNLTRWQDATQLTIVGPPQGTYCLPGNVQPNVTAGTNAAAPCPATVPAGYYLIGGPRGNFRDSRNQLFYDQIDLRAVFSTGAIEHTLVAGAAATWEKYTLEAGNVLRDADRTLAVSAFPLINFGNPNEVVQGPAGFTYGSNVWTGPVNRVQGTGQEGVVENYAFYLFDAMKIGRFEINGGIRYEKNRGWARSDTAGTAATLTTPQGQPVRGRTIYNEDNLFSYRIGLVYKPVEAVTLYASYANSKTPSQSSVNGSCTDTGTSQTCSVRPEGAKIYEIGAKAELMNGQLLLTASAFRNERDSYKVPSNEPGVPAQQLDGHSRVDGIALSAVGKITPQWSITANYTYLNGELLQSVSDFCLDNPGATGCANSAAFPDPARGAELANTPKHAGSIFTTYTFPFGLTLGYGATYQGSFAFGTPSLSGTTLSSVVHSDDYWVHNAYIAYAFDDHLNVQVNVKNFTDELYYTRIRNNGWATPGDARAAVLTVGYRF